MPTGPIILTEQSSALQDLLDAPEWLYLGHTDCEPIRDEIALPDGSCSVVAWAVYEMLDLCIIDVCRVYPNDAFFSTPNLKKAALEGRIDDPASDYFKVLKFRSCPWHYFGSWRRLSRLTGRVILFYRDMPVCGREEKGAVASFSPDETFEEHPSFIQSLARDKSLQHYLRYMSAFTDAA